MSSVPEQTSDVRSNALRDFVGVLRRRRLVVILTLILVPGAAVGFSLLQKDRFQATAKVLLSRQNLANSLTGTPDPTYSQNDFGRIALTQAELARGPVVARRTLDRAGETDRDIDDFLHSSDVQADPDTDLLTFIVQDLESETAKKLAAEYAVEYTRYRRELDTASLARARAEVMAELGRLNGSRKNSFLYKQLIQKEQQLRTLEALQTSNAAVVANPIRAHQVSPRPLRNAVLAVMVGLILAAALALLWEALDTRVRTPEEISDILGMPFLAALPPPPRELAASSQLVTLADPRAPEAEAFRVLRTSLEFVNLERQAGIIQMTSSIQAEGKSTSIANLAVIWARAGRRVVLVDLDLRRPFLDKFFSLQGASGVTDVALGRCELVDALVKVDLERSTASITGSGSRFTEAGQLQVLVAGTLPPDPGEFVASAHTRDLLHALLQHGDVVLVDSPPLLQVGDPLGLSAHVDALIFAARPQLVRRGMLREAHRLLQSSPAEKLGVVLTGVSETTGSYGYGYGYGHGYGYGPTEGDSQVETS